MLTIIIDKYICIPHQYIINKVETTANKVLDAPNSTADVAVVDPHAYCAYITLLVTVTLAAAACTAQLDNAAHGIDPLSSVLSGIHTYTL